jgi:hypothetical protein
MTRAAWRWMQKELVAAAICSLLSFGSLEYWFFKTAPTAPVSSAPHAIKWSKATIYLTDAQQRETDTLFWSGPVLLLVAIVLNYLGGKWFGERDEFFKLGHCENQIRRQGVKTGQYPPSY